MGPRGPSFHCRKAVAPLKEDLPGEVGPTGAEFPLPKGGGPIEGSCRSANLTRASAFPLPKGGGPIEAFWTKEPADTDFDRLKGIDRLGPRPHRGMGECHPE